MADMEQALQKLLDNILNERNYTPRDVKIKAISSDGANFTTALFTIEVTSPNKDDLKLFAKVCNIGDEIRKVIHADSLYETERYVYTELMNVYEDIQDEHEISEENRMMFPKFYGLSAEKGREIIVLENLVESGYKSYDRFECLDWDTARAGVESLAKFHALSFAFEKKYPEKFNEVKNMRYLLGDGERDEKFKAMWLQMIKRAVDSIENPEWREIIEEYVTDENILNNFNVPIGNPVICHGDYRLSNLMFKGQGDSRKAMILDYQTVHGGCPAADLIYFIFLGSDEKFRARYYEQLVARYYSSLQEALARLCVDALEVYPRDKFDSDIKQVLPTAALIGVMILPTVTVEPENAPRFDKNFSDLIRPANKMLVDRFNGIINDCFNLGIF